MGKKNSGDVIVNLQKSTIPNQTAGALVGKHKKGGKFTDQGVGAMSNQMGDTLGMVGMVSAGQTLETRRNEGSRHHQRLPMLSDTTSNNGGVGYTPNSIMSPIKYGTGIGHLINNPAAHTARLGEGNTLYNIPSPIRIHPVNDPVLEVDQNMREQQALLEKKLQERKQIYKKGRL